MPEFSAPRVMFDSQSDSFTYSLQAPRGKNYQVFLELEKHRKEKQFQYLRLGTKTLVSTVMCKLRVRTTIKTTTSTTNNNDDFICIPPVMYKMLLKLL